MLSKRTKLILGSAVALALLLAVAVAAEFFPRAFQPASKQFSFSLTTIPDNGTVVQGGNTTITVDAAFQNGASPHLTLTALGGPNGTIYSFTNQTRASTQASIFSSNLTISVPQSAASDTYAISVTGFTVDGETNSTIYTLDVVNSEVQLSGTVTATSRVNISLNRSVDSFPTEIIFDSTITNQTYQTKVHITWDANGVPQGTGNYSLSLPNQQRYRVTCLYASFPYYIPVERVALGGTQDGWFTVDCGAGVNAITANFTG